VAVVPGALVGRRLGLYTVLLAGLTAFGPLSMDLYLPAFPVIAADLNASEAEVQLTLVADAVGLVVGQLLIGPWSDACGRRRLLLGSTLVCAAASVLCALSPTALVLAGWRFLQGASGGGGIVLARAVAADLTSGVGTARLFSFFITLSSLAPIAAPIAGGALLASTGSWRVMFYLLAGINVALAMVVALAVPESLPASRRHTGGLRQTAASFRQLARDRAFTGYALTIAFAFASLFGYIAGSSFALQEVYGLTATQFSLVFALNAAGMVSLGLLNARLVRRHAVRTLLLVGLIASAFAAAVLLAVVVWSLPWGLVAVLLPLFAVVASRGLVSSNATVLAVARSPSAAGSASAVLGACMFAGGILVSPLLGLGPEGSPVPMVAVVSGASIAALLATVLLTSRAEPPAPSRAVPTYPEPQ
jgi:DHA1 family bicyclomycin/chloramphenicol resistance-like MFS transporter